MKVTLGPEKLISQAPVDTKDWGPWQFPRVFDAGNRIYLEFHVLADSALSYGSPRKWIYSDDKGKTWNECENGALKLDNGDLIKIHQTKAIPEEDMELPKAIGKYVGYGFTREYFKYEDIPEQHRKWFIERTKPGQSMQVEEVTVELPDYTMNTSEGVFPRPYFHQIKKGPNGSIWTFLYKHYIKEDGKISEKGASWFHKSTDNGKTWKYMSRVPYQNDIEIDTCAKKRYGYGEPDMCFIDENTAFALHRTTDGNGFGPMYITWTKDGGLTWTKAEYFDDRGVWPQTVKLDNGAIIAGYGRPGLFIRPYLNGKWHDRIAVVEPMDLQTDTCSYCALIKTGPDTALVFYSDFNYPDENGVPRKSIMSREITVEV